MALLYDIVYLIFIAVYLPVAVARGKWPAGLGMRFGAFPKALADDLRQRENIWVHAVSVGEVLAVAGLIQRIKSVFPRYRIVLSTVTRTGYELAKSKLSGDDVLIFAPLDFSWAARKYVRLIRPKMYLSAETEIWPNLFAVLSDYRVPLVLVNGRISEKSFRNYRKVRMFLKGVLQAVTVFGMQTEEDAARILEMGAPVDKIRIFGNIKFDGLSDKDGYRREDFGYKPDEAVWIAGSTHPGEEEIVLDVFARLRGEFPSLRLIVAPRHVERGKPVSALVESRGFQTVFFSKRSGPVPAGAVLVVDTIGHLRPLYGLASVVFMGKSLRGHGGQNIIEPAVFGKPILTGPHMENFRQVTELFLGADALVQVSGPEELYSALRELLRHPDRAAALGGSAKAVISKCQGATQRALDTISSLLPR
ncbi:MAG: 3-deoxy-D-manno-octulosonic acid transferase [Candidatus Omnitrophota bacterium]|nr:3-deoxy-D-manno-octulosonic acid transferase [Candidatus Omnitrophota bacterium]MDZ4242395.1 3-deoxy-D-manno-octulosonic acid transferase [Candidatus Omnitrophota bacterium]